MSNNSENKSVILASFTHFRHIKTRKVVILECEVAEELFQDTISKLGMPIGGESKPVAIALLKETVKEPWFAPTPESEKLRVRSVLLCKNPDFQRYLEEITADYQPTHKLEEFATTYIYNHCNINSRSELATNPEAQTKFKEILSKYETWKLSKTYEDNLNR